MKTYGVLVCIQCWERHVFHVAYMHSFLPMMIELYLLRELGMCFLLSQYHSSSKVRHHWFLDAVFFTVNKGKWITIDNDYLGLRNIKNWEWNILEMIEYVVLYWHVFSQIRVMCQVTGCKSFLNDATATWNINGEKEKVKLMKL